MSIVPHSFQEQSREISPDILFRLRVERILREADAIENALRGPIPDHSPILYYALKASAKVLRDAADRLDELRMLSGDRNV